MRPLKQIPETENIEFKPRFIDRYSKLTDWESFKKYSLSYLNKSIRINTLKTTISHVKKELDKDWILEPIPWCKEGFWIEHKKGRLDVGNTIEHQIGYYYVQEAASMIPPIVLDPKPGEKVLDLCASPGSKTTQMAQYMENKGIIVANDIAGARLAALGINLQRCGVMNAVITQRKGEHFKDIEFDKVLVDAPCSGTGTIRKSLKTLGWWNPNTIKNKIAGLQKKLILAGYNALRRGGTMVYSTCSLEPDENEAMIDFLLEKTDAKLEEIELNLNHSPAVAEFEGKKFNPEVKKCLRLWPQDNNTEGFFVCKIKKE